jgi:hypothetical protein
MRCRRKHCSDAKSSHLPSKSSVRSPRPQMPTDPANLHQLGTALPTGPSSWTMLHRRGPAPEALPPPTATRGSRVRHLTTEARPPAPAGQPVTAEISWASRRSEISAVRLSVAPARDIAQKPSPSNHGRSDSPGSVGGITAPPWTVNARPARGQGPDTCLLAPPT